MYVGPHKFYKNIIYIYITQFPVYPFISKISVVQV